MQCICTGPSGRALHGFVAFGSSREHSRVPDTNRQEVALHESDGPRPLVTAKVASVIMLLLHTGRTLSPIWYCRELLKIAPHGCGCGDTSSATLFQRCRRRCVAQGSSIVGVQRHCPPCVPRRRLYVLAALHAQSPPRRCRPRSASQRHRKAQASAKSLCNTVLERTAPMLPRYWQR